MSLASCSVVLSDVLQGSQIIAGLVAAQLAPICRHIDTYVGAGNSTYVLLGSLMVVGCLIVERVR